jgi:hypothetical protein
MKAPQNGSPNYTQFKSRHESFNLGSAGRVRGGHRRKRHLEASLSDYRTDEGVIEAMMKRLPKRLRRARGLERKVNRGERLNNIDVAFLTRVLRDAHDLRPFVERHPEYKHLCCQIIDLYVDIANRACENEKHQA